MLPDIPLDDDAFHFRQGKGQISRQVRTRRPGFEMHEHRCLPVSRFDPVHRVNKFGLNFVVSRWQLFLEARDFELLGKDCGRSDSLSHVSPPGLVRRSAGLFNRGVGLFPEYALTVGHLKPSVAEPSVAVPMEVRV